VTVFEMMTGF